MIDSETLRAGRTPFELKGADNDYSGLSISDRYLASANLEKSFFNGVNLSNCAFAGVELNNTEFSEAKVERSYFDETNLAGCDFVDCLFQGVAFSRCNFEKGEWRDATFVDCKFADCNFTHTTVTLCRFANCEFDERTLASIEHRSVYFNVFTICRFGRLVRDAVFASRNFGTPAKVSEQQLVQPGAGASIEQICLLNNHGHLRTVDLADVAESICSSLGEKHQRRNSTLTFFSKIVRTLTDERRISATSLIYLEDLITSFASSVEDRDLFMAAMVAVVEIRSALFTVTSETSTQADASDDNFRSIKIYFSPTYVRHQVEVLRDALAESAGLSSGELKIEGLKSGSTIIDMASTTIVSAGAILVALNFVLRQATVTVQRVSALRRAVRQLEKGAKTARKRPPARNSRAVKAILRTGAVAPELAAVRMSVRRSGRVLVEMDETATVTVLTEQPNRR